jgi:hypothetical protein
MGGYRKGGSGRQVLKVGIEWDWLEIVWRSLVLAVLKRRVLAPQCQLIVANTFYIILARYLRYSSITFVEMKTCRMICRALHF